jgi:hypothetical protein
MTRAPTCWLMVATGCRDAQGPVIEKAVMDMTAMEFYKGRRLGSMGLLALLTLLPSCRSNATGPNGMTVIHPPCHRTKHTVQRLSFHLRGSVKEGPDAPKGIPGVHLTLSGPQDCQEGVTTHAPFGLYEFSKLPSGTYTVTPTKEGCTFDPSTQTVELAHHSAQVDFIGRCPSL